ncbi:S24 family peptidase [Neorhizobium sp. S3-V5DH]|uniref:S24 family peptidase n=1 Tax=Neorhizobium sp. S3-V5DH TaxID=2485166 RepID=UPI00104E90A2|nr:S24 family peptidase [Neorhizobium sp. S3-V5DH]
MDELRQAIKDAVDAGITNYKGLSAAIKKNHAYVQQFVERGTPRELKERDERLIRDIISRGPGPQTAPSSGRQTAFKPIITPGSELVGARDFPIFAAAQGGEGHVIITFDPVEMVKRPAILEGVRDAYGVLLTGSSMEPAYWPGDMALVHPHLPPARDSDVVLFHVPPHNEAEAIIKRLTSFNDSEWRLKQYNPAMEFTESRVEWSICHRVVGKYNAR